MARDVLCEVSNCAYWGTGNVCNADQIYVVTHQQTKARTTEETDCQTFKAKG